MARITVWDEINFGGYATEFTDSIPNLSAQNGRGSIAGYENWNDQISCLFR